MSQPSPYSRQANFVAYALANPGAPYNPALLDAEFNAVQVSLNETIANLGLIQRDDGQLQNGIVTADSLDQAVVNMIGDWYPRGAWAPATNYAVRDMVTPSGGSVTYVCAVANTSSSSFATDDALGYWQPVNGIGTAGVTLTAADITFLNTDRIIGRSSSGGGAGQEIVCTAAARSILDDSSVGAIATTLGLGTGSNPTFALTTVSGLTVSGFNAKAFVYSDTSKALVSTAAPTNGQLLIGSTGNVPALAALTGTTNQVVVTNGSGSITLALPQDIATASTPVFANVQLTDLSAGGVIFVGGSSTLSQDNANFVWDFNNNALGLGTAAPTSGFRLDVVGLALFQGGTFFDAANVRGLAGAPLWGGVVMEDDTLGPPLTCVAGWRSSFSETGLYINTSAGLLWQSNGATGLWGAGTTADTALYRDGAGILSRRYGTTAQEDRLYGTYTSSSNYQRLATRCAKLTLASVSGATVTATSLIPDGAVLLGVTTRVTVALGTGGGTTGYQVGDGSDADRWGDITGTAIGTTSDNRDATASFIGVYIAAGDVVFTAKGGNFNGTGSIEVCAFYSICEAD